MEIFLTQDGSTTVNHPDSGVSFHSKYGAITESNHVFIENGLQFFSDYKDTLRILEVGFGTGLNVLLTFFKKSNVIFHSLDPFPLDLSTLDKLNYPSFLENSSRAANIFQKICNGKWDEEINLSEDFKLQKFLISLQDFKDISNYNLIFYDAFAPSAQPELWTKEILKKVYDLLLPGGIFVTYCAKGSVKRIFKELGAEVYSPSGPPGKREMTRVIKPLQV
ncbi:MAG: tRNA (5-methylaminomethyl-2-thiouridine)(34)-methyltransferase MnmD [Bacteroidota bacterium]|jgi:tRNA U34 5-methylaminomethyl-2-thiouridine-forming methyltransferase MnmC